MYKSNRNTISFEMQLVCGCEWILPVQVQNAFAIRSIRPCTHFTILSQFNDDVRLSLFKLRKMIKCLWIVPFYVVGVGLLVLSALVVQVLMQFADLDRIKFQTTIRFGSSISIVWNRIRLYRPAKWTNVSVYGHEKFVLTTISVLIFQVLSRRSSPERNN